MCASECLEVNVTDDDRESVTECSEMEDFVRQRVSDVYWTQSSVASSGDNKRCSDGSETRIRGGGIGNGRGESSEEEDDS